jgi:Tol biopolymer transport system component
MRLSTRYGSISFLMSSLIASLMAAGCDRPNPQDRAVNWSGDGRSVAFEHGVDGPFLANCDGGQPRKILQPQAGTTATSPPLWSPTDSRIIFTTTRRDPRSKPPASDQDAIYTCWLRAQVGGDDQAAATALFEEPCALHFVRMNMAVRWHPSGKRVLFIRRLNEEQHGLFEFDLASKQSHRVFPHTAPGFSFEWAPGGGNLVCVLGGDSTLTRGIAGLWIGEPSKNDWWHVPTDEDLSRLRTARLDEVRARQPVWTRDGARFAVAIQSERLTPQRKSIYQLLLGTPANRKLTVWQEGAEPFLDLRWSPDGKQLGFLRGSDDSELCLLSSEVKSLPIVRRKGVRRFIGWDASGQHLAFVAPERVRPVGDQWALLFVADALTRDRVYLAAAAGAADGQAVLSGMHAAFPQWSPRQEKLSLRAGLPRPYRWTLSVLLEQDEPFAGAPAVLDCNTKQLAWLPVDTDDRMEVAHYHLVKGEYTEAWRWYERVEREIAVEAAQNSAEKEGSARWTNRVRLPLFEYYCLSKLGRRAEARQALARFDEKFSSAALARSAARKAAAEGSSNLSPKRGGDLDTQEGLDANGFLVTAVKDVFFVESSLALSSDQEAAKLLREFLAGADGDRPRLAHAIFLGQILLVQKHYKEYAKLAANEIIPLVEKVRRFPGYEAASSDSATRLLFYCMSFYGFAPLLVPEFLANLSSEEVNALVDRWQTARASDPDEARWLVSQLGLYASYTRLGRMDDARLAEERVNKASASPKNPFGKGSAREIIDEIRREAAKR